MELANKQIYTQEPGFFKRLSLIDWLYGAGLLAASLFGLVRFGAFMDIYEKAILLAAAPTFAWLGWYWKPVRWLIPVAAVLSLFAIELYGGHLDMANQKFFLKYILSSQSAILWMGTLFVLSTLFYWIGLVARSEFGSSVGSLLCWARRSAGSKSSDCSTRMPKMPMALDMAAKSGFFSSVPVSR